MDNDLKQKWVNALRSGNYTQGRGGLRTANNEYCCLGVLCDVTDQSKWVFTDIGNFYAWDGYIGLPPISWDSDMLDRKTLVLSNLNDGQQKSFSEIADWIEENL